MRDPEEGLTRYLIHNASLDRVSRPFTRAMRTDVLLIDLIIRVGL